MLLADTPETPATNGLLTAVGNALTQVISWVGDVVGSLVGNDGALSALLPLFAIGIGISVLLFGIRAIRSIVWGA